MLVNDFLLSETFNQVEENKMTCLFKTTNDFLIRLDILFWLIGKQVIYYLG